MKRMGFGWLVTATIAALVSVTTPAQSQDLPPTEPILRIETGMHTAPVRGIGVDAACRLIVTASDDKTARLWALPENDKGQPTLLHVLRVPIGADDDGKVSAMAISPDGKYAVVGGYDVGWRQLKDIGVYLFDTQTGQLIRRLGGLPNTPARLSFSPDGKFLAATLGGRDRDGGMRVWETTGWRIVGEEDYSNAASSYGVAFDVAGNLYTVAFDGFLRRYGPSFKLEAKSKTVGGEDPRSIAVHPKGDRLAVGFNHTAVEVYGVKDLERLFAADLAGVVQGTFYNKVAWSVDGERLYAAGGNLVKAGGRLRIWEQEGRVKARDVILSRDTVAQLLPCRDEIAVGVDDPAFGLISATGEKQVWQEGDKPDMRRKRGADFTVSDDGRKVRFGLGAGGYSPVLFDLATSRLLDRPQPASWLTAPDAASLAISDWQNDPTPKLNGKTLQLDRSEVSRSVAIAPRDDRFVLGTDSSLRAYDRDGKELWRKAVPGVTWGVNIPRGGKFVVAAYGDGTIRWHRLSDGEEVVALFVNAKTREWVLWTPQGYYTSSVYGDQMVGWHLNKGWEQAGEFVTAARLKKHLYRPDIVNRAFDLADAQAAVREAGLSGFELADLANHTTPEFRIVDPGDKSHTGMSPVAVRLALGATNDR
jgi:hypothetical protein